MKPVLDEVQSDSGGDAADPKGSDASWLCGACDAILLRWRAVPRRLRGLLSVLFLVIGLYAGAQVDSARCISSLEAASRREVEGVLNGKNDIAVEYSVFRPYVLLGPAIGKASVFVRQREPAENPPIHLVNFHYVRRGGEWMPDGSDASASEENHQAGLRVFERRNPEALKPH